MPVNNPIRFEGETDEYRSARNALLEAEAALRQQVSAVAQLRSELPLGHKLEQDYVFERQTDAGAIEQIALSDLFVLPGKSLVIYSFMNAPGTPPCPMCNAFLDSFDGVARHANTQLNLAVVAKAPAPDLSAWAAGRGWSNLRLLSSANNHFNQDYLAESDSGDQHPMLTTFRQQDGLLYHQYSTELLFVPPEPGQHPRHMDMLYPLWNLFDLTVEGRPRNWMPNVAAE